MKGRSHLLHADDERNGKPLIISVCRHGVTDSFATRDLLRQIPIAAHFEIIARGVDPIGKPQETHEGIRGLELQVEDIRKAVLLLIHKSNEYVFRQRFGVHLTSALDTAGYLYVRDGREAQHVDKNTGRTNAHIASHLAVYQELLLAAVRRSTAAALIGDKPFTSAETNDAEWQALKNGRNGKHKERHPLHTGRKKIHRH